MSLIYSSGVTVFDRHPSHYYSALCKLGRWFGLGSNNNIGIVTGEISGIAVVDFDTEEAFHSAQQDKIVDTPLVRTSKGYHAYYRYPPGIRNSQKRKDKPGVDIQGDSGYVVAPPSKHANGITYSWVDGHSLDNLQLAEFPGNYLAENPEEIPPIIEIYDGVPEGMRNESLANICDDLIFRGFSHTEALQNAKEWNQRNVPPLDVQEVERTVTSIYNRHFMNTTTSLKYSDYMKIDLSKVILKGYEIMKMDIPMEWIIDDLLPKQNITLLSGRGGIGKTWLCLQMAHSISKGIPFMGLETMQAMVFYIDFENSIPVLKKRIDKLGITEVNFWHSSNTVQPPRIDQKEFDVLKRFPENTVIIIDTFRAAQTKDENNSQEMTEMMNKLKKLRDIGFTIVLLHHTPKSNDQIYKGSSAISDQSDHVLYLVKKDAQGDTFDEENTGSNFYRLGTKEKTRCDPFHIYLRFDPDSAFVPVTDPDVPKMEKIKEILNTQGSMNQTTLCDLAKEQLGIKRKGTAVDLLKKGEGRYWTSKLNGKERVYSVLSTCPIYIGTDNWTDETKDAPQENIIPFNPELVSATETSMTEVQEKESELSESQSDQSSGHMIAYPEPCYICKGTELWRKKNGDCEWICARCHPPVLPENEIERKSA